MRSRSSAYIVLQENLSAGEEAALQQAVADALPPISPSYAFVEDLGRDLVAEARRRQDTQQQRHHVARTVGLVGGGVLSVVGGFVIWFFVNRHQRNNGEKLAKTSAAVPVALHAG